MKRWSSALLLAAVVSLAGCDLWMGEDKTPLPGERLSVLTLQRRLEPDPALATVEVRLPRPVVNANWPEAGGYPSHAMQHVALPDDIKEAWRASIGDGDSSSARLLSDPVVFDNRVYAMDASSTVRAFDAKTGKELWHVDVKPEKERGRGFGGGVAYAEGKVFVTTGYAQVVALDAETGKEIWRQNVAAPMRGAPTVADGRVFAITVDNQLEVLSTADGRRLWTHNGTPETAGLLVGTSPAVEGEVVVVPYSSGELFALRIENGRPLWSDNLATARPLGALATLADIRGLPVVDRGRVFAASHSGRMVSIDLRSGDRVWDQELASVYTPWVAGDFVYVLSEDGILLCLLRQDGRVRWAHELPRFENPEKRRDPIRWAGPVLAGDRLLVLASNGKGEAISPYTGEPIGKLEFPDGVYVSPAVAASTLYVVTDEADLIAMR
jgi:outer membrane protein assembly factor BamB